MMRINDKTTLFILFLVFSVSIALKVLPRTTSAQTIPTRTPTPPPATATSEDDGDGEEPDPDPGQDPTPVATSTSQPAQPTATNTPVPLPPTPEAGFLPTAEPCSLEPTLRSVASGINVRSGPGLDYGIVGTLLLNEVRPIVGRAAQVPWWQIVLADGTTGWVSDSLVEVSGYIGQVPEIDAPALESGVTVTPGTPWAPTPRPNCTPPPSATPTGTATADATSTPTASADSGSGETAAGVAAGEPSATPAVETPTATPTDSPTPEATVTLDVPTAAPLPVEDADSGQDLPWMPVLGIGLVLVAAGIFVVQRIRR